MNALPIVTENAAHVLGAWSNFYVILGSAAGALTGLMFVVITLVAGDPGRTSRAGVSTFSSPTVVHFCIALFASAILVAPWQSLVHVSIVLGLAGVYGVWYAARVLRRTGKLEGYEPEIDDWMWYAILPLVAYVALTASAIGLAVGPAQSLFAVAATVVALIFIGIHNSWDVVTYIATRDQDDGKTSATAMSSDAFAGGSPASAAGGVPFDYAPDGAPLRVTGGETAGETELPASSDPASPAR